MVGLLHTPPPPQWYSSAMTVIPQSWSALLSLDWRFDISFSAPYCLVCWLIPSRMGAPQSPPRPWIGAPLWRCRHCTSHPFGRGSAYMGCFSGYGLHNPHRRSLASIFTHQFHSALLNPRRSSLASIFAPQNYSALLLTISTPLAHIELHIRHSSLPGGATCFPQNSSYLPFKLHLDSPLANLNYNLFHITNRAKRHWN